MTALPRTGRQGAFITATASTCIAPYLAAGLLLVAFIRWFSLALPRLLHMS